MKRIAIFPALASAALLTLAGCFIFPTVEGSGFLTTTAYNYSGFTKVDAAYCFKVSIEPGPVFSIEVFSDDNLVQYLDVRQDSGSLILALMPGYNYINTTLTAEVHMPVLSGITLSGASESRAASGFPSTQNMKLVLSGASTAELQTLDCGSLSIDASGASEVEIGGLSADSLDIEASGASSLEIEGSVGSETVDASGASEARLIDCPADHASVTVSGASKCWVDVPDGTISLDASGGSILYYSGDPVFSTLIVSGGSQVIKLF
jgi:hypothetical protein